MKKLVLILDPAHGEETPGKRSPDGKHREYKWSRNILKKLDCLLKQNDYRVEYTTTTDNEPGLTIRKNFASNLKVDSNQTKLLISLHNNAAGNGSQWMKASGIEVFTTVGQTKSDTYAEIVINQLQKDFAELKFRLDTSDGDKDKEENFTVLTGSGYTAMLIEWLFQDNKEDVEYLLSDEGRKTIAKLHVDGIVEYLKLIGK